VDIWKLLAGLGIFLLGMMLMEEAIQQVAGNSFKRLLRRFTSTRWKALGTGIVGTAILQSSSAVTLMTLSFVGAGIIQMQNALGLIIGTNLGTTATSWMVATMGFKVNVEGLFLPLVGIGGLGLIFLKNQERLSGISKILAGLGFVFMGLEYMKDSVAELASALNLQSIPSYGLWFYILVGIILTAVMQSSSATMAIVLTSLFGQMIDFRMGAAMVIGANIGTTITVLIGSLGGIPIKKQVASSHLIFNVITGIIAWILFEPIIQITSFVFSPQAEPLLAITLFHTIFNGLGALLFIPFVGKFADLLRWLHPEKSDTDGLAINRISPDLGEAALSTLHADITAQYQSCIEIFKKILRPTVSAQTVKEVLELHAQLEKNRKKMLIYSAKIQTAGMEPPLKDLHRIQFYQLTLLSQILSNTLTLLPELETLQASEQPAVHENLAYILQNIHHHLSVAEKSALESLPTKTASDYFQLLAGHYKMAIDKISEQTGKKSIKEKHALALLIINGTMTQNIRQLYRLIQNHATPDVQDLDTI